MESANWTHATNSRRTALQVGAVGLLGLGMNDVAGLRSLAADNGSPVPGTKPKAVIYIFISGGSGSKIVST